MKIRTISVSNFRSLKRVEIPFDRVTTFIGPNGTGKSTVLRALDWFFNSTRPTLTDEDCSFGVSDANIEVAVTFDELTDKDREALGKYAPPNATTFTAWKLRLPSGEEYMSANAKGYPAFADIKAASSATEKKTRYRDLRRKCPDLELPSATTGPAVDETIIGWESAHIGDLEDAAETLQTNFFGFNGGGKMSGLFDFVLVTADLRASEESLDTKSSIIGRILERTVDRSAADEEVARIVEDSRTAQRDVFDRTFGSQLQEMTTALNGVVGSYSPGRSIVVKPADVELKAPKTTFNVSVLDGDGQTAIAGQGHGFQRTLLISSLQLLARYGAAAPEGVICLAIEEPELFQHPVQAQAFAKILRSLAEDAEQRIQVTYATHSAYFIEASRFEQVRRLTRSADPAAEVTVHHSTVAIVKNLLKDITKPTVVDSQLDATVASRLSVALFANKVLLVEGSTEVAVIHGVADRDTMGKLEAAGVSVVEVGGKSNLALPHAILTSLGIPTCAMFDGDKGYEARATIGGKELDKIAEDVANHIKQNRALMSYFGLEPTDFPPVIHGERVTVLEDHLETILSTEWAEWQVACDAIEKHTGVNLRKNQHAYRKATRDAEGTPSAALIEVIRRCSEITV